MLYQNADQQVIGFVVECLAARRTVWLCTVLSTFGSSPRPRGSLFAFDEQGAKAGSLSGGCVEEDLVERTLAQHGQVEGSLQGNPCEVIVFGATPEEAGRLRLPCGGLLRVAVERYGRNTHTQSGEDTDLLQFREISRSLNVRTPVIRKVRTEPHQILLLQTAQLDAPFLEKLTSGTVIEEENGFHHFLGPSYTLFLIGVSEVSKAVATMALLLDYEIMVCDPRSEALREWNVDGVTVIQGMPDDVIRDVIEAHTSLEYTAILALTHDPRIDDMGLMEALTVDAFYIGALGSERSSSKRRERLLQLDITPRQLEVLHAPIGLDIHSKTPAEIALSILGHITQLRRARSLKQSLSATS